MKRIYLILSLSFFICITMSSQIQFGFKGGVNSTNISLKQLISDENEAQSNFFEQDRIGYQLGIFTRLSLLGFYAEPNLLLYRSKFNLDINGQNNVYKLNEINIPLFVGIKLNPIRIFGGPVIYMEDHEIDNLVSQTKMQFKESNYGFQTGIGLDIKKIKLELIYENISHSRVLQNTDIQTSNNVEFSKSSRISLMFGFKI